MEYIVGLAIIIGVGYLFLGRKKEVVVEAAAEAPYKVETPAPVAAPEAVAEAKPAKAKKPAAKKPAAKKPAAAKAKKAPAKAKKAAAK